MTKEERIKEIARKLYSGGRELTQTEIEVCIFALRKQFDCLQEPYFEVVYHDEFDRKQSRIMNPESHSYRPYDDERVIVSDKFEVNFERVIEKKGDK